MSLFRGFNPYLDEAGHFFLSATVALLAHFLGTSMPQSLIIFAAGILIDIDHIFNTPIAKSLKLNFIPHLWKGSNNYVIKIFHGIDIALILMILLIFSGQEVLFSFFIALSLIMHLLWDFLTYNAGWSSLLLITRLHNKFYVPDRTTGTYIIFSSLPPKRMSRT